jgi:hypothetical protein
MAEKNQIIKLHDIQKSILTIRGKRVMLDSDLAGIYGVTTKRLNQQLRRNIDRFPEDFMFQLTKDEKEKVVANCDHLNYLKFSPFLPNAFTEHGAIMLATILNSKEAVQASIFVVRAFIFYRETNPAHSLLFRKIELLEKKYDTRFHIIFKAIKQLMNPPKRPVKKQKKGF